MQLDRFLIALILVSCFATVFGGLYVHQASKYGVTVDQKYQAQFNKLNQSYALTEQITTDIKGAAVDQNTQDDWDIGKTFKTGLNIVKIVFIQGVPTALSLIGVSVEFIPYHVAITSALQAIVIVLVVFALVYLYFRYKNE